MTGYVPDPTIANLWDWRVIQPKATVNHVVNPSFEAGTTNWTLSLASVAATHTFRGLAGLYLPASSTPTAGAAASQTVTVNNAEDSAYASTWIYLSASEGASNVGLKVTTAGGSVYAYADNTKLNCWQRISVAVPSTGITNTSATVVAYCNHTSVGAIWWDAFDIENGTTLSSYFDGDELGCRWLGRAHYSTSLRPIEARMGGVELSLATYMDYKDMSGWGNPPMTTVVQPFGLQGGEVYQRSLKAGRVATITGKISAPSGQGIDYLHRMQADLEQLLSADTSSPQKPVGLIYDSGYPAAQELATEGVCEAGLEFATLTGLTLDPVALRFHSPEPYMRERQETAATIAAPTALAGGTVIYRPTLDNEPPTWQVAPGNVNGIYIAEWVMGQPGVAAQTKATLWCGGDFTALASTTATGFAVFDPSAGTLTAPGGSPKMGVTGSPAYPANCIHAICQPGPQSPYVYIGGSFTGFYDSSGASHAWPYLVRVNIATLAVSQISYIPAFPVLSMTYDPTGDILYVGTTVSGEEVEEIDSPSAAVVGYHGAPRWGFPVGQTVVDMTTAPDGSLYLLTGFAVMQGLASGNSWNTIGTVTGGGAFTVGQDMVYGPDGQLYVGGGFTSITPGGAIDGLAKWNGGSWSAVGSRGASAGSTITSLNFDSRGRLHIGGCINFQDLTHMPPGAARLTVAGYEVGYAVAEAGSLHVEQVVPISNVATLASTPRATVNPWDDSVVVLTNAVSAIAAACSAVVGTPTAVQYNGSAPGPCVLTLTAGSTNIMLGGFRNERTHTGIYFNNLVIFAGERFSIDTTPGSVRVWSDLRPNLLPYLSTQSDITGFQLLTGTNYLSVLGALQYPFTLLPASSCLPPSASVRFFARHKGIDGSATGVDQPAYIVG